jgi:hypothetical protein
MMNRRAFSLLALASACGSIARACGDKLLAIGHGVFFQRSYIAKRPASIIIYVGPRPNSAPTKEPDLQASLKTAGHKPQLVTDEARLRELLQSGHIDLVLADYSEAGSLKRQTQASPSKPSVLPMLYKPSKTEFVAASKVYPFVLKTPSKGGEYLLAIDEAMKERERRSRS